MGFKVAPTFVGYTETNVNMKNTGSTLIFTNPNSGGLYFPTKIRIYGANLTAVGSAPTFTVGTNASTYNNILSATTSTALVNASFIDYAITFPGNTIAFDSSVFVNVTNAATGTNYGCRFAVFMDYF